MIARAHRAATAALVVGALAAVPLTSCGDEGSGAARSARPPEPAIDYVKQSRDVGGEAALERVVNVLARMQRDFRAGDMEAVCARVSPSWVSQFPPNAKRPDAPCAAKVAEFARRLERAGVAPRKLDIAWARIYDAIAGISVTAPGLARIRIPFVLEDGAWKLQLGIFPEPEVLNDVLE